MQCLRCGETRYSRDWNQRQWKAWTPEVGDYNCCRQCSPDSYVATGVQDAAFRLKTIMKKMGNSRLRLTVVRFIVSWGSGDQPSQYVRKTWSYYGGIRKRRHEHYLRLRDDNDTEDIEEKHFAPDEYYDPGNLVYMYAMQLMFLEIFDYVNWNCVTVGDIFESILGLYYLRSQCSRQQCPITLVRLAEWIDEYVSAIYEFMRSTAWQHVQWHSFEPWCIIVTSTLNGRI